MFYWQGTERKKRGKRQQFYSLSGDIYCRHCGVAVDIRPSVANLACSHLSLASSSTVALRTAVASCIWSQWEKDDWFCQWQHRKKCSRVELFITDAGYFVLGVVFLQRSTKNVKFWVPNFLKFFVLHFYLHSVESLPCRFLHCEGAWEPRESERRHEKNMQTQKWKGRYCFLGSLYWTGAVMFCRKLGNNPHSVALNLLAPLTITSTSCPDVGGTRLWAWRLQFWTNPPKL